MASPSPSHPWWRTPLLVVLVISLGVAGFFWWRAREAARGPHWETRLVDRGPIDETVLTTGTLQPVLTVNVGSQISGQISAVYVDFNSRVTKGQLLARIDPRTLQAQREQTEADLSNAQAAVQNATAGVENARTGVSSAEAGIASAQAALAVAQATRRTAAAQVVQAQAARNKAHAQVTIAALTYERNMALLRQKFIAPQDADTSRANLLTAQADEHSAAGQVGVAQAAVITANANVRNAEASLQAARVKRETAQAALQSAIAQRQQARAQVEKTQATLRQIMVNLGYVEIRSPVNGIVISRQVDPGQTVAASFQTPLLFQVATDLRRMQILASVDESDVSRVFVGQSVSFTVNAWPSEVFRGGRVISIRNAAQSVLNVVTYPVLIDVRNDALKLRPGMTANLTMEVAHRDTAVRVPNAALRFRPPGGEPPQTGREQVYVPSDEQLQARPVRVGITDGVNTEVLGDTLRAGDAVVVGQASATAAPTPAGGVHSHP